VVVAAVAVGRLRGHGRREGNSTFVGISLSRGKTIEENLGKEKGKVPRIRDANQPASDCIVV